MKDLLEYHRAFQRSNLLITMHISILITLMALGSVSLGWEVALYDTAAGCSSDYPDEYASNIQVRHDVFSFLSDILPVSNYRSIKQPGVL
jgi:hypothetical protein